MFFDWLGRFVHENPWPTIVILLIVLAVLVPWTRYVVTGWLRSIGLKKLKFSGAEIEFSQQDRLIVQQTFDDAVRVIRQYRKKVESNVKRLDQKTGLDTAFRKASAEIFKSMFDNELGPSQMRATIHVQDYVLEDHLYQIVNYYPTGGGAYRNFSLRQGIIGRVWRSKLATSAGFLTHKTAPNPRPSDENLIGDICLEWGLTDSEAIAFKRKPSYCCVPIMKDHRMLGVFYMDCETEDFGWPSATAEEKMKVLQYRCTAELASKNIPELLLEIEKEMSDYATRRSIDD